VIAVTDIAGHAFESWTSRDTHKMWLKDFLPHDVQNIRIMSYGYDSSLLGHGTAKNRQLDHTQLFIHDIENARSSVEVSILVSKEIIVLDVLILSYQENPIYHIHWT
jgi:hypothetical protein